MASETKITAEDCLKGAFAALLRGDTAERDRLCALAERSFRLGETEVPADRDVFAAKTKVVDLDWEDVSPVIWQERSGRWHWAGDEFGDMVGGFPTLESCLADAQNIFGADARIVRHTDAAPAAEGDAE